MGGSDDEIKKSDKDIADRHHLDTFRDTKMNMTQSLQETEPNLEDKRHTHAYKSTIYHGHKHCKGPNMLHNKAHLTDGRRKPDESFIMKRQHLNSVFKDNREFEKEEK